MRRPIQRLSTCPQRGARAPAFTLPGKVSRVRAGIAPVRPQAESPCARALSRHGPDRRRLALDRRHRCRRPRARAREPARRLRRGDAARPGSRLPRGGTARRRRLRDEGVPERRADADPRRGGHRRRRLDARRAPVRPGSRDHRRRPRRPREQQVARGARGGCGGRRARRRRLARGDRTGARGAASRGHSCESRPGSRPTRTRRFAPAITGRSSGSRPTTRSRRSAATPRPRGSTCTSALSCATSTAARAAVDWIAAFAARAHAELGWTMRTLDLGGGLGVAATPDEPEVPIAEFAGTLLAEVERACEQEGIPMPRLILEPGRSLTARAGVTLYTVGSVKRSGDSTVYLAVDGGMSDNPRPALYGARYTAVLANRADEPTDRHLHGRRQALRVRRPPDRCGRAPRAPPRRHPRRARDRRLHPRDELHVQRRSAPRRGADHGGQVSSDPPSGDDRGSPGARGRRHRSVGAASR